MPVSSVFPARIPFISGFTTGQMTIPAGAGPFAIQALGGSIAVNGSTLLAPYSFTCDTATSSPITVGATGAGGVAVSYLF